MSFCVRMYHDHVGSYIGCVVGCRARVVYSLGLRDRIPTYSSVKRIITVSVGITPPRRRSSPHIAARRYVNGQRAQGPGERAQAAAVVTVLC